MASTLSASAIGLEIVDRARQKKDWTKIQVAWQVTAEVSKSTLDRFWMRKPIKRENFKAICTAVGVDWEQVIDKLPEMEPSNITRKSNLDRVNQPVILELKEFGQQIFDWFGALDFKFEGLPRQEGKYVEWIIQVPVRRAKFDRVLIRATIHEVGLNDLDNLRRGVAQYKVDEGWLVTNLWVNQSVRQALIKPKPEDKGLTCVMFDELIDQDADFTPYVEWLKKEVEDKRIVDLYVPLNCQKGEFDPITRTVRSSANNDSREDIDFYIDRWLASPVTEHVSILGEFGTGKTWFTLHYAWKCLQDYQIAKAKGLPRPRLPLVIRLRDYAKSLDVSNVMAGFFFNEHNIKLNHAVFDKLNQMGKLLLIFDGFDEMANKVDRQKMVENFRELAQVVMPNSKVLLTCRTEHFDTAQDAIDNLNREQLTNSSNRLTISPKFQTVELMKLDDEQIRDVLSRRTNGATVDRVMANEKLLDLLQRAVMAEYVLEALPDLEQSDKIDISRVYLYAVKRKMNRDITTGRTFTSLADKLYFLCELSWEMLSQDKLSLNYREFPERLRVLFKDEVKEQKHLDHWHYDMMGQTILNRNDDGDYRPAHKSLLEFFVAYKFAAELGLLADDFLEMAQSQSGIDDSLPPQLYKWSEYWRREVDDGGERRLIAPLTGFKGESLEKLRDTFGSSPLAKSILDLLLPSLNLEVKYRESNQLLDLIKSTNANEVGCTGGNAATILVKINPHALEYQDLNGTTLAHADLVNAGLRGTNLSNVNLENCQITRIFGLVNAIVMSKDDRQFITAHDDNTIRIWDRANGRELQNLTGHEGKVNCLALNADGDLLYSGSIDGTIREWRIADGIYQRTFADLESYTIEIALSENGQFLYSGGSNGKIKEWNLSNGICERTFEGHTDLVRTIVLSRDGQFLYSGSNDWTIKEWNLSDSICRRTFRENLGSVTAIVLSPDGELLYAGSGNHGIIREWNLADGSCQKKFRGTQGSVNVIAIGKDSRFLYSGSHDGTIKQWEIADGNCQKTFDDFPQDSVLAIAVSGDGQFLYSGGMNGNIREWSLYDGIYQKTFESHQNWLMTIAVSEDEQFLYSGSQNGTIKEWRLSDGICQRTFQGHQVWISAIALSEDGQFLYSGSHDGTIEEWRLSDGIYLRTFYGHTHSISTITLSEDGQSLYSGSGDRTINEWRLSDGTCKHTLLGKQVLLNTIAISRDGKFLYSSSGDPTINEWRLSDGTCQRTFPVHRAWMSKLVLSKDGRLLYSAGGDGLITVWDVESVHCLRTMHTELCAGANITNVKGLTTAQTESLLGLGAISDD